ncbi:cholesterol catabolism transcriptional regulator KstR [Amycolatopsis sp. OK19-0408]|uniref:Cholesterol catabolism transcriptional regulator KstR n=1 Tax=Amycolatopsis iheyensis TaxID=2945988 RepID=A0A9X2NDR8_9PSEU|nr:cholesterol catabolism transcriptional regulator KstR [Amycolatopsis iheyensis]MCR6485922.1 cholesterol catabolism transcriptional regulator KstR [Amycolatopsis iheyensis]
MPMPGKAKAPAKARGNGLSAIGADELGSAAQRDRRRRIIDATLALASKGGYDAVQMRAVAEKADVALGTLYRYFPSKIHLLVSGLAREFERAQEKLERSAIPGETPAERLMFVLGRNTRLMQRDPHLTEAMVRAFMFADTSAAAEVEQVGRLMENMFAQAMGISEPTEADRDIFHVVADVWMANLVAWVTRRASAADVANRLELSVHLLLDK